MTVKLIGDSNAGTTNRAQNFAMFLQFTASATGICSEVLVYAKDGTGNVKVAVYDDTGANYPNARLAKQDVATDVSPDQWNTISLEATCNLVSGTKYWLTVSADQSGNYSSSADVGGVGYYVANTFGTYVWPATAPGSMTGYTKVIAIQGYGTVSTPPEVTTDVATAVAYTTATLNGTVTEDNALTIDYYGFVWDLATHGDPGDVEPSAASDYALNYKSGSGNYGEAAQDHDVTSLNNNDRYYFRFCAHNAGGWTYGDELYLDTPLDVSDKWVEVPDRTNVLALDNTTSFTPDANYEPATKKYVDDNKHTQGTDTALGAVGTKNPPIDADKAIYRDSTASDALVTSTWTQVKAFLKTYWDTLYAAVTHAATHTNGTDDIQNATAAQKGLATAAQITKLDGIEALADVTDATNVSAAGAVMKISYNADTILAATSDNLPAALTLAEQTLVGRITGGHPAALSVTQTKTLLGVAAASGIASLNASTKVVEQPASISDFLDDTAGGTDGETTKAPTSNAFYDHTVLVTGHGHREKLTAARTYYVRTDGNDSNTGLVNDAGGAFLTIQKAVDVTAALDLGIYDVTIQVGDGTYTGAVTLRSLVGSGAVIIQGNAANHAAVIISTTSADCFTVSGTSGIYELKNMKLQTTTGGNCIAATLGSVLYFSGINFGACAGYHICCNNGAIVKCTGNYDVSGNAVGHLVAYIGALIDTAGRTITYSNNPVFSNWDFYFELNSMLYVYGMTFTNGATVTGKRYNGILNAACQTNGGGANYVPGDSAGTTATGAQYA